MEIATGSPESHPTPLPLDASQLPGVAPVTPVTPVADGFWNAEPLGTGARDLTGERLADLGGVEAECSAAQSAGMSAEHDRRSHYQAGVMPLGSPAIDEMSLPPVPDNAVPPAQSDLYPYAGMEPTPAGAGFYHGDTPDLPQ